MVDEEFLRAQRKSGQIHLPFEKSLRQRRALIGRVRFVGEQDDRPSQPSSRRLAAAARRHGRTRRSRSSALPFINFEGTVREGYALARFDFRASGPPLPSGSRPAAISIGAPSVVASEAKQSSHPRDMVRRRVPKTGRVEIVSRTCGVGRRGAAIGGRPAAEPWIASLRSQ